MKSLAYLFIPLFCLLSCVNESRTGEVLILTRLDGAAKSRLIHDENGLERVNEVCCFAYDSRNGLLETTVYQRGNSFSLSLDKNAGHRLYVLANLGDQCSMAPVRMDGMSDYSCPVPAIREMSRGGLPMCGAIDLERGSDGSEIRLRRLMARLVVNIRTDSEFGGSGAVNAQDIKVLQCPNVFYPFSVGGSSARRAEEVSLTAWDSESLLFSGADNIELFVPENCQGDLLGSGVSQMEKSLSNPELDAVKGALCTYIEVEADKNNSGDGVSGNLTYRFFPGNGSAKNFISNLYSGDLPAFSYVGKNEEGGYSVWAANIWYNETMGKYCMYFCTSSSYIKSALALAVSDVPEGPYTYVDTFLCSGFSTSEAEKTNLADVLGPDADTSRYYKYGGYDNTKWPNCIDPAIYTDDDGKIWMVYGSWSGGLFTLEIDPETGLPIHPEADEESGVDPYFGYHLIGGGHHACEGPFIFHNEENGYYYLFVSCGSLGTTRKIISTTVSRSWAPMTCLRSRRPTWRRAASRSLSGRTETPILSTTRDSTTGPSTMSPACTACT